ncbi:MAG: HAD-IA family hydrolase, partial [bacterium]|nr:HAD-IA family hydrolase [Candidatus Limimorpha equi]
LKPNAEVYEILLRRSNIKPEESVFIDDNVNNIRGGENVGIQGVIFKDAERLRTDLEKLL